jgi:hypothetical protein
MIRDLRRRRDWETGLVILVASLCLAGGASLADGPRARCRALLANGRALVDVDVSHALDSELLELVRLGLQAELRLEVSLAKKRPFWFDDQLAVETSIARLEYSTEARRYVLDRRRVIEDPETLGIDRISLRPTDALEAGGQYHVDVRIRIQVITPASLDRVARWMSEKGRQNARSGVSDAMARLIAENLTRATDCRCEAAPL